MCFDDGDGGSRRIKGAGHYTNIHISYCVSILIACDWPTICKISVSISLRYMLTSHTLYSYVLKMHWNNRGKIYT